MSSHTPLLITRQTCLVEQPIDSVFRYVSNHENYQHWYPGVESVSALDDTPPGRVGKTYRETIRLPSGRLQKIQIATVESEPPTRFVTQGDHAALKPQMTFDLQPLGDTQTQVTWMFFSRHKSPIQRLIVRLLFRPIMKRQAIRAMESLKRHLDQTQA